MTKIYLNYNMTASGLSQFTVTAAMKDSIQVNLTIFTLKPIIMIIKMPLQMRQQNNERFLSAPSDIQTGKSPYADRSGRDKKELLI